MKNHVDNTKKSPSVLSFCTGYGGIEIGLERAIGKINVLAHVEIEAYAIANLVAKMETGAMVPAPVWTNLKTFPAECFSGSVDIITGGYPCQPFSAAGQRKGADDPRHLWPWIKEYIRVVRPGLCFFENVEGHISLGLREVLTDLVELGYRVESDSGEPTWGLFSAAECGAPHQRKRVFILAYTTDTNRRITKGGVQREAIRTSRPGRIRQTGFNLADTCQQGPQRRGQLGEPKTGRKAAQNIGHDFTGRHPQRWPARPGEPQHEWEEPRILADPSQQLQYGRRDTMASRRGEPTDQGKRKTKYGMGRAINGTQNRVDRLRLLGNGVVPATAEKAFLTLLNRIENPHLERPQIEIQMDLFPAASNYI